MGLIQNSEQIEYWTHLKTKNTGLKVQGRQVSELIWFELNWTILYQIIPPNWTFVFYQLHSERASEHYETHIPGMPTADVTRTSLSSRNNWRARFISCLAAEKVKVNFLPNCAPLCISCSLQVAKLPMVCLEFQNQGEDIDAHFLKYWIRILCYRQQLCWL